MCADFLSDDIKRKICHEVAKGIVDQESDITPEEKKELGEALCKLFIQVINEPTFGIIWNKGKQLADTIMKKNECSGYELVGKLTTLLYESASEAWMDMQQSDGNALMIMKGLLYAVGLVIAVLMVISMQLLEAVGYVVFEVAKAAWTTIKAITGFMWSLLLKTVNHPASWGVVVAAGARLSVGNALIGALVIAVGVIGMAYTTRSIIAPSSHEHVM